MKHIEQLRNNIAKVMGAIKDANSASIKGWDTKIINGVVSDIPIGYAISIELDNTYFYNLALLSFWGRLLEADDCTVSARNNQLKVKFTIKL